MDSNINTKKYLHSIYIYLNNENDNFFATNKGVANETNFGDTKWLEYVKPENRVDYEGVPHWFEVRSISGYSISNYSVDVITLYKKLYRSSYSQPAGLVVLNIHQDYYKEFIEGYLMYKGQSIILVDNNDQILCKAGEDIPFDSVESLDEEAYQKKYMIAVVENEGYGLKYISIIPKSIIWKNASDMIVTVGVFLGISLTIGLVLAYAVTKKNTNNVQKVVEIIDHAQSGTALPEITGEPKDEFGYIVQNIIKNFVEKSYLQMQLAEKKYNFETMYFSFLQSQLNPHFLFNTLKNIFWKSMKLTDGPNETSEMIDLLTNLLHYALVNPSKYVKISEEIKMTNIYFDINQMRFDNHIYVKWNVEKGLDNCKSIKFR